MIKHQVNVPAMLEARRHGAATCAHIAVAGLPRDVAARVGGLIAELDAMPPAWRAHAVAHPMRVLDAAAKRLGFPVCDADGYGGAWGILRHENGAAMAVRAGAVWWAATTTGVAIVPASKIVKAWRTHE